MRKLLPAIFIALVAASSVAPAMAGEYGKGGYDHKYSGDFRKGDYDHKYGKHDYDKYGKRDYDHKYGKGGYEHKYGDNYGKRYYVQ